MRECEECKAAYKIRRHTAGCANGHLCCGQAVGVYLVFHDAKDIALTHNEEVFPVERNLGARVLTVQHLVAFGNGQVNLVTVFYAARTNRYDSALLRLFLSRVRNVESTVRFSSAGFGSTTTRSPSG